MEREGAGDIPEKEVYMEGQDKALE